MFSFNDLQSLFPDDRRVLCTWQGYPTAGSSFIVEVYLDIITLSDWLKTIFARFASAACTCLEFLCTRLLLLALVHWTSSTYLFFSLLFQGDVKDGHPRVMSFLLFINFLFLISPRPYLWVSFEFSPILSTVDLSKQLITAWIIRKFIQLVVFFGNLVWLNLYYDRALSGTSSFLKRDFQVASILKTFMREFIQCRAFLR